MSLNDYININREYSLSSDDLQKAINCQIVRYQDVSLNNILPCSIIHYPHENNPNSGHWVLIFENKHGINYFDSYGYPPDYHSNDNKLLDILKNKNVYYNDYQFQKNGNDITTCGRWVMLRWLFRKLSGKEFKKLFSKNRYSLYKDDIAVLLTSLLY